MQWSPIPATAVSSASDYPDFIPLQVIDAFSSSASDWGATSRQAAGGAAWLRLLVRSTPEQVIGHRLVNRADAA
jgi:hypothetical protein